MNVSKKTVAIAVAAGMVFGGAGTVVMPTVAVAQSLDFKPGELEKLTETRNAAKKLIGGKFKVVDGVEYSLNTRADAAWLESIDATLSFMTSAEPIVKGTNSEFVNGLVLVQPGQQVLKDGSIKTKDGTWVKTQTEDSTGFFKFKQDDQSRELEYADLIQNTLQYSYDVSESGKLSIRRILPAQNVGAQSYRDAFIQDGVGMLGYEAIFKVSPDKNTPIVYDVSQMIPRGYDVKFFSHLGSEALNSETADVANQPGGSWSYDESAGTITFTPNKGLNAPQSISTNVAVGRKGDDIERMIEGGNRIFKRAVFIASTKLGKVDVPKREMQWNADRTLATASVTKQEVQAALEKRLAHYYGSEYAGRLALSDNLSFSYDSDSCIASLEQNATQMEGFGQFCPKSSEKVSGVGEWSLDFDKDSKSYVLSFKPEPGFKGQATAPTLFGNEITTLTYSPATGRSALYRNEEPLYAKIAKSHSDYLDIWRIPVVEYTITAVEEKPTTPPTPPTPAPTCDACAELKALKPRVDALEKKVNDAATKQDHADLRTEIDHLIQEGNASQEQLKTIEDRVRNLEDRVNLVHETANNAQDTANLAIEQIKTERNRIDQLVKDVDAVKNDVKKAQQTADNAIAQSNATKTQLDNLQKQLDTEKARIDKNESEIKRLEGEITKTNAELAKQTKRVDELLKVVADQKIRLDNLQNGLNEANKRLDQYKADFDALVERVTKNEKDTSWLALVVAQHEKELQAARDAIAAANDLIAQLRVDVDAARKAAEMAQMTADQAIKEIAAERERVDALTARVDENEKALADARAIADQALANANANEKEIAAANEHVTTLENELKQLKHELAMALLVLHRHEQAIDALGERITEVETNLKAEIAVERERVDTLVKRVDAQQVEIDMIAKRLKDHEARIKKLESQVDVHELMRCTVDKSSATVLSLAALAIPLALLSTVSLPTGPANQIAQANTQLQKQMGMYNEQLASAISGLSQGGNPLAGLGAVVATLVAVGIGYNAYSECAANQNTTPIIGGSSSNGSSMRIDDLESVPAKVERGVGLFQRIADRVQKTMSDLGI